MYFAAFFKIYNIITIAFLNFSFFRGLHQFVKIWHKFRQNSREESDSCENSSKFHQSFAEFIVFQDILMRMTLRMQHFAKNLEIVSKFKKKFHKFAWNTAKSGTVYFCQLVIDAGLAYHRGGGTGRARQPRSWSSCGLRAQILVLRKRAESARQKAA